VKGSGRGGLTTCRHADAASANRVGESLWSPGEQFSSNCRPRLTDPACDETVVRSLPRSLPEETLAKAALLEQPKASFVDAIVISFALDRDHPIRAPSRGWTKFCPTSSIPLT
jgi:hypothetical protein